MHTATFFSETGLVDIALGKRTHVIFTLDGSEPALGEPNTATCGTDFTYESAVVSSMYGPKGCEVAFPEGRWMPCAVAQALDCDEFCTMLNRSLSSSVCSGPFYVVTPPGKSKIYPTWEGDGVPAILPVLPTETGGMGSDAWLGDPGVLTLKMDPETYGLCFKIREIVKGQLRPDLTTSRNWPHPKCDDGSTFGISKTLPPLSVCNAAECMHGPFAQ